MLEDGIWLVTSPNFANLPLSVDDNFIGRGIQRDSPPMFIHWVNQRIVKNSRRVVDDAATIVRIFGKSKIFSIVFKRTL